jgi:L-alanine-DL-glutamate epimerase-like enolase superfamily enzyme
MRNDAGAKIGPSYMGRREFLRRLGATVGAAGIAGIMSPFDFARAAITPGERGIYITDMYKTKLDVGGFIIRLDTNKGISGYGECRDVDSWARGWGGESNAEIDLSRLMSTIIGMNPTQVDKVFNATNDAILAYYDPHSPDYMYQIPRRSGAMCAIETACWDITGKVYNVPIWKLIGPKLNDKIQIYIDTDQKNAYTLPAAVETRLNLGFKWFKADMYLTQLCTRNVDYVQQNISGYPYRCYVINDSGIEKFVNYASLYRSLIGPDYPLASDHYQGWGSRTNLDIPSAIKLADAMSDPSCQGMNGGWMEDIIQWWYPEQLVQVTAGTDMPILTGEDMYCLSELKPLADVGGIDFFHPDQATFGGIHEPRLAALYAYEKGILTALHCSGGPFSFIASLHVAAGIPDFLALEYHYLEDIWWFDTVIDGIEKPLFDDGFASVPDGPGLGITPNATNMSAHGASEWIQVT